MHLRCYCQQCRAERRDQRFRWWEISLILFLGTLTFWVFFGPDWTQPPPPPDAALTQEVSATTDTWDAQVPCSAWAAAQEDIACDQRIARVCGAWLAGPKAIPATPNSSH